MIFMIFECTNCGDTYEMYVGYCALCPICQMRNNQLIENWQRELKVFGEMRRKVRQNLQLQNGY